MINIKCTYRPMLQLYRSLKNNLYLFILILLTITFVMGCKKNEVTNNGDNSHRPYNNSSSTNDTLVQYSVEGSWLLTSAKRITRHTTTTWGDSVNYFWYPQLNYPIKYYRNKVYDTINVGTTEWTITSDKIYQGQSQFYYDRKNANSAYCDQIQIDFYDTYMIAILDSNKMVLETNAQVDILSGFFLFEHFTILEFQKISNANVQNTHYFNKSLDYCLKMNQYDSILISDPNHEVQSYDPYQVYNNTNPVKGTWEWESYTLIDSSGFPIGSEVFINDSITFFDSYYQLNYDSGQQIITDNYTYAKIPFIDFYQLDIYGLPVVGTIRTSGLPSSTTTNIDVIFSTDVGTRYRIRLKQ